jgi:hypothetical protein
MERHKPLHRQIRRSWSLVLACLLLCPVQALAQATQTITLGVDTKLFQFPGDWMIAETSNASGGSCLFSGPRGAKIPAATAIEIPRADRYYLWVRAMDFPNDHPGTRTFTVSVGKQKSAKIFGASGKPGFSWEFGGFFDLPKGQVLLGIYGLAPFARTDALLLTTDSQFKPSLQIGEPGHPLLRPSQLARGALADPLASVPVTDIGAEPAARLENEFVRLEYLRAMRGGRETVRLRMMIKTATGWTNLSADPSAEIYAAVAAGTDVQFGYLNLYPAWKSDRQPRDLVTVEAGGARIETAGALPQVIWNAGQLVRFLPRAARTNGDRVRLEFYPSNTGTLTAEWELRPGERTTRVKLVLTPATPGQFALGYHLFFRRPLAEVKEILLPMMWQRHRFPDQARTLLDPFTPTPIALAETVEGGQSFAWALIGDPKELPFNWPTATSPHFGMMIRDNAGAVQPSIYGPVPGTDAAKSGAGRPVELSFRVLVQPGDWYSGYRTAADQVFGLRDYRRNVGVSLTDAALNMIDLVMDDAHAGWWERAKAFYQVESKNGSTQASPATLLSLYRITGDPDIYRRRALPTMEFMLSRRGVHFSPLPSDTGGYDAGGMNGPVNGFGTDVFGGMWELAQQRTQALAQVALPANGIRSPGTYNHLQPFDEWLARYELTGDHEALLRASTLADEYLAQQVQRPPANDLGTGFFFFVSAVPDWEGLLRLYEATGKRQYLVGAIFGARQLMTGLWTQPMFPAGNVKINPSGQFVGESFMGWRGATPYRLGFPRKPNDTPEHEVPAWIVSNVGLGIEQPSTFGGGVLGQMIYQMVWAPDFLRLAQYTGDQTFETYARNAVIGRWATYPGYYATGFTDLPLNPRYPYNGPDVTSIYYHHIVPQLAWTIDYLVAEALLRSGGKIQFPSTRQDGYAYFDTRVYGHAPGRVYNFSDVWLWLGRGLVTIDNPQINYLAAHNENQFFLMLMNESPREEAVMAQFSSKTLKFDLQQVKEVAQNRNGAEVPPLPLEGGIAKLAVPPRGLVVLRLDHANIDVPTHQALSKPKTGANPGYVKVGAEAGGDVYAAALQAVPGPWDAYVWCTASPKQANRVRLKYNTGDGWHQIDDSEYPFEFSVPVADPRTTFRFFIEGTAPDGKTFRTAESVIGAEQ